MTANNKDVKSERKPAPRERKLEGKVPLFNENPRAVGFSETRILDRASLYVRAEAKS